MYDAGERTGRLRLAPKEPTELILHQVGMPSQDVLERLQPILGTKGGHIDPQVKEELGEVWKLLED